MNERASAESQAAPGPGKAAVYVTVEVADQLFGVPIEHVQDVFVLPELTPVPLAPPEVAGLLNLRGRVVTAIDLRRRFGIQANPAARRMAIGIGSECESFGFLVDAVGDVLSIDTAPHDDLSGHHLGRWAPLTDSVHRVADRLMVVMNVRAVLDPEIRVAPAAPQPPGAPA